MVANLNFKYLYLLINRLDFNINSNFSMESKVKSNMPSGEQQFLKIKTYSPEEILAAGGTTAHARKTGKSYKNILNTLKYLPKDSFLSKSELEEAINTLNSEK